MKTKKMKSLCTALTLSMIVNTISVTTFATDICETDTQEPMRYLTVDTAMVVATPIESGWKTTILATDVDSSWNETDDINVVDFDNALISKNEDNSITMEFNDVDYENGMLVVLLFYNENKREYAALQIDFSDTGIPTFRSEIQRNRVMQNSKLRSESIILDDEKPDDIHDAKQEFNKMEEPLSDIAPAESQGAEYNAQSASNNLRDHIVISDWAIDEVEQANSAGLIPDNFGIYDYTQEIKRDKFCELALQLLKSENMNPDVIGVNPFTDTSNDSVIILSNIGIINGKEDNIFAPDDDITREEAATILYRMAEYMDMTLPMIMNVVYYYDENQISDWAHDAVVTMREMLVMNGTDDYDFTPKGTYTVEQAIITMLRLYKY